MFLKMKPNIVLIICLLFSFLACKTKVDINADPKETMVIYGLLDQGENIQYIKVNKTFLGDENNSALDLALNPSRSNYDPSEIEVFVERWNSSIDKNKPQETYSLRDTFLFKSSGVFYSDPNPSALTGVNKVYYFKPATKLNSTKELRESIYKVVVKNKKSGVLASGNTPLINSFSSSNDTNAFQFSPSDRISFLNENSGQLLNDVRFKWNTGKNGRLYQLIIKFYYTEINKLNTADSILKSVDWIFPENKFDGDYSNASQLEAVTTGKAFYQFVKASISPNENVWRKFRYLEFRISAAEDYLATYMDVNKPNSGFNIDKPALTNIKITREGKSDEDGIGLFSSRATVIKKRGLARKTLDTLKLGYLTRALEFRQ